MKKTFCIVMMLIFSMFVFTGCSGAPTPESLDRWQAGETQTFAVSLLTKTTMQVENDEDNDFYDYPSVSGVQIKPDKIEDGSFMTYTISKNASNQWVFDVEMQVTQTYNASQFPSDWKSVVTDSTIYSEDGGSVTFTSTMTSRAVFNQLYNNGKPVSSFKKVKSVVIYNDSDLKPAVAFNDFETTVTYSGTKAKTTFTDRVGNAGKESSKEVDVGSDLVFDNEAMLLAIRSVDFEMLKDAKNTTLRSFNSVEQKMQEITVVFGSDSFKLDPNKDTKYYRIGATPKDMGYAYYMYFEQAKRMSPVGGGGLIQQQRLVEMNQGYMHFKAI